MSTGMLNKTWIWLEKAAWAAVLFFLPVTSFPYFPNAVGGEALVRPLSLYPLVFLILFSIIPKLFRKPLPKNFLPLLFFILVAVGASLLSLVRSIEPALGVSVDSRVLRGVSTLAIGCAFFVTLSILPQSPADLRFSLRWIYAGIGAAMLWGSAQAYNILAPNPEYFAFLEKVQRHISTRRLLPERISGMTYEPHWFAEQIILLLIPYALAAVLIDTSAFKRRWRRLSVEWFLLGWALVLLPFTYSRAGLINLIVVLFLAIPLFRPRRTENKVAAGSYSKSRPWMRRIAEISLLAVVVAALIFSIGGRNPFFARIWGYWMTPNPNLQGYLSYLGFDARLVYAQAAYNTYQAHPLSGVGLGNYAFYFEEMLPYRPIAEVPEILLMITPEIGRDRLITSKNFFLRILAETGIIGWIAFLAFFVVCVGYAIYLWLSPEKEWKYWGMASLIGLIAFSLSALTFDSFVIPNMWVLLGLVTAATRIASRKDLPLKNPSERNNEPNLEPARRTV